MEYLLRYIVLLLCHAEIFYCTERCAPIRYDIAFYFNRHRQTGSYTYYIRQKSFAEVIIDKFPVGYMQTRFAAHIYGGTHSRLFDFKTKTTKDAVKAGFPENADKTGNSETKENIRKIWNSIFLEREGDRSDVQNYCFMFASVETNLTYESKGEKPSSIDLWIMDAQDYFNPDEYSDDRIDEFANKYKVISDVFSTTVYNDIAAEFTSNSAFDCKTMCGENFFAYDYPSEITSTADTQQGVMTVLMDTAWDISCCAVVKQWSFWVKASGLLNIGVLRPNGTNYYVVGFNEIIIPDSSINREVVFKNGEEERIAIKDGDKIAWYSSGQNIIAYESCSTSDRSDCPQNTKQFFPATEPQAGDNIDLSTANTITNKAYSIMLTTTENSAQTLTSGETETDLEWNTEIGTTAIFLTNTDLDAFEEFTYTMTETTSAGATSYFELNIPKLTIDLKAKLPLQDSGPYIITVTNVDTCEHTSSVTVTIGTYNAPPIVTNLPYILEIIETTREALPLYQINVIDATNDPICCTMPYSVPASFNFELKQFNNSEGGIDLWLYTRDNPVFEYSDIDSFRVFVCCQDAYGSSFSYLVLRLIEVKQETPYVPPDWFYRALILSLTPLSLMTAVACIVLLLTVFWF